ncbi:MAG: hypothetical protein GF388_06280, partial [Candidatus Aegiribacteria sp.]|nr:hypothetical protein [Candidatus Aegiribacteria sp.]MBD3294776.1 hypothetical protein [Candidatus Fermentibacteria bacterium]
MTRYCSKCHDNTEWHLVTLEGNFERDQLLARIRFLFQELVTRLDYETVLSDTAMVPQVVNGVAVADSISTDSMRSLVTFTGQLDSENHPIPITDSSNDTVGYFHYGSDNLERELILVPYVELGIILLIVIVSIYVLRKEMKKEKELSWIGFAKETAHQISTPLTSLMGWMELLKGSSDKKVTEDELHEAIEYMEDDIERLHQITSRYGQIGKKPVLKKGKVNSVILDTVHYFTGRPGFISENIELETDLRSEFPVMLNDILLSWVLENLLKNSIAALRNEREGVVRICSRDIREGGGVVEIEIADNGRGIPFSQQKKIFRAGFTTRRGGWGLGLTLSRRIVESYHEGSLELKASSPGHGTTFVIKLPAAEGDTNRERNRRRDVT